VRDQGHELTVIYAIDVIDRPGVLHAITAVFADRGLSMEGLVAETARVPSRILVAFRGSQRQCRMVEQVLPRLHHVLSVRTLPTDSPELRAIAWFKSDAPVAPIDGVTVQWLGGSVLLSGSYASVHHAVAQLLQQGLAHEVSRSLVAL
jgi:hypothetical protein